MHELTVARRLFNEAHEIALNLGIDRISRIKIKLGVASGIDANILRHSFMDHIFPETIAEDAEVDFIVEPLIAKCVHCRKELTHIGVAGGCPACASKNLDIIGGMKVVVEGVE